MEKKPFLNPRFIGPRFEDHSIPLEIFEDFSAYQELLVKVAKWIYYNDNNTTRVPKGFGKDVYLRVEQIRDGSAIPVISIVATSFFAGNNLDTYPYFERARELINETIAVARDDNDNTGKYSLPSEILAEFNKFGRRLKDDEAVEMGSTARFGIARLSKTERRNLVFASPAVSFFSSNVVIRGVISALDKALKKITIITVGNQMIEAQFDKENIELIKEAFDKYEQNCRVLISGIGIYNKQNKLERMDTIDSITILDPLDVGARLEEFLSLRNGWNEGEGNSYSADSIETFIGLWDTFFDNSNLIPYTFPTVEGGVQFEWKNNGHSFTLLVDLENYNATWFSFLPTGEFSEGKLELALPESWEKLNQLLSQNFKLTRIDTGHNYSPPSKS